MPLCTTLCGNLLSGETAAAVACTTIGDGALFAWPTRLALRVLLVSLQTPLALLFAYLFSHTAHRPASVTVRVRVCRSAADPFA